MNNYLTYIRAKDILILHARVIDKTGGSHGVREIGLLTSLSERPRQAFSGKDIFPDIFEKAAAYFDALIHYHVFIDGNKRTAVIVSARFLFLNNYTFTASNKEVEDFAVYTATEKPDIKEIAKWFRKNSRNDSK